MAAEDHVRSLLVVRYNFIQEKGSLLSFLYCCCCCFVFRNPVRSCSRQERFKSVGKCFEKLMFFSVSQWVLLINVLHVCPSVRPSTPRTKLNVYFYLNAKTKRVVWLEANVRKRKKSAGVTEEIFSWFGSNSKKNLEKRGKIVIKMHCCCFMVVVIVVSLRISEDRGVCVVVVVVPLCALSAVVKY